jgi:polyhydroxyalkanoate synthesis regulator phasin
MNQSRGIRHSVFSFLRRGMLFSVGSVLLLQEKVEDFAESAVAKGQQAESEGKKMVQEMRSGRKKKKPPVKNTLDGRINSALERLDVPSQQDIDQLDRHITELSERIDDLKSAG